MPSLQSYLQELSDPVALIRKYAVRNLGGSGDAEVTPHLVAMLGDPDEVVRIEAVWSLTRLQNPDAVSALVAVAEEDPSPSIQEEARKAADILSRLPQSGTVPPPLPPAAESQAAGGAPPAGRGTGGMKTAIMSAEMIEDALMGHPGTRRGMETVTYPIPADTSHMETVTYPMHMGEADTPDMDTATFSLPEGAGDEEGEDAPPGPGRTVMLEAPVHLLDRGESKHSEPVSGTTALQELEASTHLLWVPESLEQRRRALGLIRALGDTDVSIAPHEDGFRIEVPLGPRRQKVFVVYRSTDDDRETILSVYTQCGPATSTTYRWALLANAAIPFAALGIREVGGKDEFVMLANLIERTADSLEIRKTVLTVAEKGDWVEHQLTGKDEH